MINQLSIYFIKIIKIIKCYKTFKIFIKIYCNIIKIKNIGKKSGGPWPLPAPPVGTLGLIPITDRLIIERGTHKKSNILCPFNLFDL